MMKKLNMQTNNVTNENIEKIGELFPNCITESKDGNGKLKESIDFDLLKQELSVNIVEGPQERYHLDWPGKRKALVTANAPINKTLRLARDESVSFDTTENLFIEGDNLDALKLLQKSYLGKVKMIYIDPPYNTGKDFIYSDKFAVGSEKWKAESGEYDDEGGCLVSNPESNGRYHSDWLSMIYPRLKLSRNLLRDDGVIFISIDDSEVANLNRMCNEIFGEKNYICTATRRRRKSQANLAQNISTIHEYVMIYSKSNICSLNKISMEVDESKYSNPDNDPRGPYVTMPCTNKGGAKYSISTPTGLSIKDEWRFKRETYDKLESDNRLVFSRGGNGKPRYKLFLSAKKETGVIPNSWWDNISSNQEATIEVKKLFDGEMFFDFPKPVDLVKLILQLGSNDNDLVLDFFAGSSTTAHAIIQLNAEDGGKRKFIMVQLPEVCDENSDAFKAGYETIAEISKERIRRAGRKIKEKLEVKAKAVQELEARSLFKDEGNQKSTDVCAKGKLDTGFRVLKIDSSNMADVYYTPDQIDQGKLRLLESNVVKDRTSEDLLFQVLLDWGVDLTLPIKKEAIGGLEVLLVDNNALAACFETGGKITEDFCRKLASHKPLRVVFQDSGFKDDSMKINVEQIFKLMSPQTEVRTI
jgi:adenine-specific DNA-methyltransferase